MMASFSINSLVSEIIVFHFHAASYFYYNCSSHTSTWARDVKCLSVLSTRVWKAAPDSYSLLFVSFKCIWISKHLTETSISATSCSLWYPQLILPLLRRYPIFCSSMTFNFVEKGLGVICGGPKFMEKKFINILHTNNFYVEIAVFFPLAVLKKIRWPNASSFANTIRFYASMHNYWFSKKRWCHFFEHEISTILTTQNEWDYKFPLFIVCIF